MIGTGISGAIGAMSKVVRLSGETAAKQAGRRRRDDRDVGHPEVAAEDCALVQRVVDEGVIFEARRARHVVGCPEIGDDIWKAVVKRTRDGTRTHLQTLHRVHPHQRDADRRRFKRIDR